MATHRVRLGRRSDTMGPISPAPFLEARDLDHLAGDEARPLETAVRDLERLESDFPARFGAPYHRGGALLLLGRTGAAWAALQRSLVRRSGFVPARVLLAEIDGLEDAVEAGRRAVGAGREDPLSEAVRGVALQYHGGEPQAARAAIERALELEPAHPAILYLSRASSVASRGGRRTRQACSSAVPRRSAAGR